MKIIVALIAAAFLLTGCLTMGAMADPVTREVRAPASAYDANFTKIVRLLGEGGTVNSSDKVDGYINGRTSMNVQMVIQVKRDGLISIKGQLPGDKFLMGTTLAGEVDKFAALVEKAIR